MQQVSPVTAVMASDSGPSDSNVTSDNNESRLQWPPFLPSFLSPLSISLLYPSLSSTNLSLLPISLLSIFSMASDSSVPSNGQSIPRDSGDSRAVIPVTAVSAVMARSSTVIPVTAELFISAGTLGVGSWLQADLSVAKCWVDGRYKLHP